MKIEENLSPRNNKLVNNKHVKTSESKASFEIETIMTATNALLDRGQSLKLAGNNKLMLSQSKDNRSARHLLDKDSNLPWNI